ncbi:MAG: polymer-forming cytoskeletal protein [Acidobacteriota bacterium]|nr:polymer-forming cytoskeletal protein [Acidobacteriota bacterium]
MDTTKAIIGPSIQIKGELIGKEDLVIEGHVEGVVRLLDHHLTIGSKAKIEATLEAKAIRIEGSVIGDVVAGERVELMAGSSVKGDIASPRISIADGARFKGSVDMDRSKSPQASAKDKTAAAPKSASVSH